MGMSDYVHLDVEEILKDTGKAFLCVIEGDQFWIPRSCVADAGDYGEGDVNCTISVKESFAVEKGLV